MDSFPIFNIDSVASILSASFSVVGLIVAAIYIFYPRSQAISIKLLGSLMVLALAFAANNAFVYSLAIFIVATLVTDLDFLEKIAALFWNRDKYWEYRMGEIPPSEVRARAASEAQQEIDESAIGETEKESATATEKITSSLANYVSDALSFERAAVSALASGKGPFTPDQISTNLRIRSPFKNVELDAIIETPDIDYVVEIKHSKRPHVLLNAFLIARQGAHAYTGYLKERGIEKRVVPIAIIPAEVTSPELFRESLPILKFDSAKGEFVDQDKFLVALRTVEEKNV